MDDGRYKICIVKNYIDVQMLVNKVLSINKELKFEDHFSISSGKCGDWKKICNNQQPFLEGLGNMNVSAS